MGTIISLQKSNLLNWLKICCWPLVEPNTKNISVSHVFFFLHIWCWLSVRRWDGVKLWAVPAEAHGSAEGPRAAQRGLQWHREAHSGTEEHTAAQRGWWWHKGAHGSTERLTVAWRSTQRCREASSSAEKHMAASAACLSLTLWAGGVMWQSPAERSMLEAARWVNSTWPPHRRTFRTYVATWDRSCRENYHERKYYALERCIKPDRFLNELFRFPAGLN